MLYVELLLKENDCPEKRKFPDVQLCPGDCQGTYLSAIAKDGAVRIIGSIYPRTHIMYNEEFVSRRNLKKEEIAHYVNEYLKNKPSSIKSYMGGRKKRIYVGEDHVQTVFEGCVFRVAQGEEFSCVLMKQRQKELERITQNLDEIKRIATLTTTTEFGKFTVYQEY